MSFNKFAKFYEIRLNNQTDIIQLKLKLFGTKYFVL